MKKLGDVVTFSNINHRANVRVLCVGLMVVTAVALSACGRGRVISTQDDSADYKSARALPPLKKPESEPVVAARPVETSQPAVVTAVEKPQLIESQLENSGLEAETVADGNSIAESSALASSNSEAVISVTGDKAKLIINREVDEAWDWLIDNLSRSDLTVFSRNKTAGRISIGCGEIDGGAEGGVKRSGGWSIFTRKKQRISEYCALETQGKRGQTIVKMLDRAGDDVSAQYGRPVLERVLNN